MEKFKFNYEVLGGRVCDRFLIAVFAYRQSGHNGVIIRYKMFIFGQGLAMGR